MFNERAPGEVEQGASRKQEAGSRKQEAGDLLALGIAGRSGIGQLGA